MRVRSAGGLLLAPLLALIANASEVLAVGASSRVESIFKSLFWPESDGARETIVVLIRDGIFGLALLVGVLALFGVRASRWPAVVMSLVLAVLHMPWVIWDFNTRTFRNVPPDWVFKYLPWYRFGRFAALLWIVVLLAAAAFALAERRVVPVADTTYAAQPTPTGPVPVTDPVTGPQPATTGFGPPPDVPR